MEETTESEDGLITDEETKETESETEKVLGSVQKTHGGNKNNTPLYVIVAVLLCCVIFIPVISLINKVRKK